MKRKMEYFCVLRHERADMNAKSAALAAICYKGLFYSTSVSPIRKRNLIRAMSLPKEGYMD